MIKQTPLAIIIGALLSAPAIAQDTTNTDKTNDTVVVTATRTNTKITDTAATVDVVDGTEIEKSLAQDLSDVLEYTPGVTLNSTQRQGIQTVNIRGLEGDRVKILVDGATQGQNYDGGNTAFINSSSVTVDPDMLKSVEIIKGAASSLYGSDAMGGVLLIETKDPADFLKDDQDGFGGQVKLTYASKNKSFSENAVIANRSGKWETMVAYTRRDGEETQNFRDSNNYSNYSVTQQDTQNNDVLVKAQYQVNDNHRIELLGEMIHNEANSDIYNSSYTNYTGDDTTKQYRLGLKHIWFANTLLADMVTSNLTWQDKRDHDLTFRHVPATAGNAWVAASDAYDQTKNYEYKDRSIEFETQLDKQISLAGIEHGFIYGVNYRYSELSNLNITSTSAGDSEVTVYTPDAKETKLGLFLQDEMAFLDGRLLITPGVRFDSYATDPGTTSVTTYEKYDDSAVTGRLGAVFHIDDQHSVYSQISQGYRAPTFTELYYSYTHSSAGYEMVPNPDLEAETSISYELGYRYNTEASYLGLSAFYSDYDNFISDNVKSIGTVGGITQYSYVNIDKATITGLELSNQLKLDELLGAPEGVSSRLAATYTHGEDGNGESLESVNPWNAVVGLNYDQPDGEWGSSLKFNYTASNRTDDLAMPSAGIIDLTAYYKPINDLTVSAGLFNLTNREYYRWNDVRSDSSLEPEKTQAKRNYSVSVKYEF